MSLIIKKCSVALVEEQSNFSDMLKEYEEESVIEGAPPIQAKMEMYHELEKSGNFQVFGAFVYDQLVGFVTVLVAVLPKRGVLMGIIESYFVISAFRGGTNAGKKLLDEAKKYAKERGASCVLVTAITGSDLEKVMPHWGGKEVNKVFLVSLKDV